MSRLFFKNLKNKLVFLNNSEYLLGLNTIKIKCFYLQKG